MKTLIACLALAWTPLVRTDHRPPEQPEAATPAAATVESLAFLAGAWVGEMGGGHVEEHWTGPKGGTIQGMFRWINADGSVALLELLAISSEAGGVVMRLRHFDGELTPWASEKTPTKVALAECSAGKAVFKGEPGAALARIVYERAGEELKITVSFSDGREPLGFSLKRQ